MLFDLFTPPSLPRADWAHSSSYIIYLRCVFTSCFTTLICMHFLETTFFYCLAHYSTLYNFICNCLLDLTGGARRKECFIIEFAIRARHPALLVSISKLSPHTENVPCDGPRLKVFQTVRSRGENGERSNGSANSMSAIDRTRLKPSVGGFGGSFCDKGINSGVLFGLCVDPVC